MVCLKHNVFCNNFWVLIVNFFAEKLGQSCHGLIEVEENENYGFDDFRWLWYK